MSVDTKDIQLHVLREEMQFQMQRAERAKIALSDISSLLAESGYGSINKSKLRAFLTEYFATEVRESSSAGPFHQERDSRE